MRPFRYQRASSTEDAIRACSKGGAPAYIAGGTTLVDLVKLDVMRPERVIDVSRLPLDHINKNSEGELRIGANARNSDVAWDATVKRDYAALSQAILSGASPQLRNMATTAGNIMQRTRCPYFRDNYSACNKRNPGSGCDAMEGYNRMHAVLGGSSACVATHPSDMCVALAIFDARIVVKGSEGAREIPFSDFHLLPGETPHKEHALKAGELIAEVVLPPVSKGSKSVYVKSRDREAYEFALASAAVLVRLDDGVISDIRVGLGGVGTKPWRSREAESVLRGKPVTEENFLKAAEAALSSARPLKDNAFKIPLARRVLRRALEAATA